MKIYISGPISGLPYDKAKRVFDAAQAYLEAQGFEVLNPTDNGLDPAAEWKDHMLADIGMLFEADAVYMLPGWEESRGARIEINIANEMGLPVYFSEL